MLDKDLEERINHIFRINSSTLKYKQHNEIVICNSCSGTGFSTREELVDYHKGDYESFTEKCERCAGDGRMIKSKEKLSYREYERNNEIPYIGNENLPNFYKDEYIKLKIDNRNYRMEQDNPELEALTYEKYDAMLRDLLIEKALVKPNDKD